MRKTKTLLGISLFGVLLLSLGVILTKSGITQAQQSFTKKNIMYTGIDSNAETLYELRFQDLTPMGIFNNNIFRTSEVSVVVNGENKSNQSEIDTSRNRVIDSNNSNILGGDLLRIEGSDGITVIGGEGNPEEISVHPNNSYATFLGGLANILSGNGEIPAVLLGGQKNIMSGNHIASAIVGGENNQIHDNARNVNILGGKDVIVEGDRSNIIIGGENVTIGEVDDVFAFSDGSDGKNFYPNMGGAFYLNVQNGVGFGTGASGSGGVVSNGAVSLGGNIDDIECNEENIGIQGTWSGCLVGCTQAAANVTDTALDTWELLDHGPSCAEKCKSSDKCMQLEEKEPEGIESYTAFCTQGLVYTGNSTICPSNGEYQDVIFETNLIDSEADCPNPDSYNQCVYKCNADTHLTGDVTGKFSGITMCFHDCRLPWDAEGNLPKKKHNERIIAYDVADAYCSNDAGKKDTCLSHKHELICVDGGWYTTNNNHKAASENTKYVKEKCTLNRYERCKDIGYDLERKNIINEKEDIMQFWGYGGGNQNFVNYLTRYLLNGEYIPYQYNPNSYDQFHAWRQDEPKQGDRKSVNGVRGIYEQCIDYVPNTQAGVNTDVAPDNESCKEKEPLPAQYHYKFIKCRDGYDKDSFGVCRKRCTFGTKTIEHNEPITLYTGSSATCTDICHAETFRCYDGTLYQESTLQIDAKGKLISGVPHHNASMFIYNQLNCTLKGVTCPGYITTQGARNRMENFGVFDECQKYSAPDIFTCNPGDKMYKLQYCNSGFYSGISDIPEFAGSERCYFCPSGYYTNGTGATAISQCKITCPAGTHVATANQQCVACPTGTQSSAHSVNGGSTSNCTTCNNKPANSHYVSNGSQNNCAWQCNDGYYQNGNSCPVCPAGYYCQGGNKISCPSGYTSDAGATGANSCYKGRTVIFYVGGNGGSDQTLTCKDYNNGSNGCSITAPSITPAAGFTVIGWSTAYDMPINDWTPGESRIITSNETLTYFAQSQKNITRTATFYRNGALGQSKPNNSMTEANFVNRTCSFTAYNGYTAGDCSVTSPTIGPQDGFTVVGYNTSSSAHTSSWSENTSKSISSDVNYYAITKKVVVGRFTKGNGVASISKTSDTCTIWNTATTCDIITMPTITCSNGYGSPSWSPSALTSISSEATATATCSEYYTCPAGKYLKKNQTTCSNCTAGYYCPGGTWTQSSSNQGIYACSAGEYSSAGQSSCSDCPCGTYSSAHSSSCTSCGDGKYSSQGSSQSQCHSCTVSKPANSHWTNVNACTNSECSWECNNGYNYNNSTNKCVLYQYNCYTESCYPAYGDPFDPDNYTCSKCQSVVTPWYAGDGCYSSDYPGCFVAGTQVTMADGSKKNIEDVVEGDQLLGNNGVNTVLQLYRPLLRDQGLISINGSRNFVTPSHPFMTTEGWKSLAPEESMLIMDEEVTLLELGDILITEDGYEVVDSLVGMSSSPDTQLYNFKVDGNNTYYADGYLVHNKAEPGPCTHVNPWDQSYDEQIKKDRGGIDP